MRNPYMGFSGPCEDHERVWNGICVDIGLEDEWLVALNSLESFCLMGICVGHNAQFGSSNEYPYIAIKYDPSGANKSTSIEIASMVSGMRRLSSELFSKELFSLTIHLKAGISASEKGIVQTYMYWLILNVPDRFKSEIFSRQKEWFEMAVEKIVEFDQIWTSQEAKYLSVDQKNG